jgi:hypothetical protein
MTDAERRRRNRARVAQRYGEGEVAPGLDGAELNYLRQVGSARAAQQLNRGNTEHAGGWRSMEFRVSK